MATATITPVDILARDLMNGVHDLTDDSLKIALYTGASSVGATTTAYTATQELSSGGYTATGAVLSTAAVTLATTNDAYFDAADPSWTGLTGTVRSFLIYNDTDASDTAIAYGVFDQDIVLSSGDFTITFPAAAIGTAALRITVA